MSFRLENKMWNVYSMETGERVATFKRFTSLVRFISAVSEYNRWHKENVK